MKRSCSFRPRCIGVADLGDTFAVGLAFAIAFGLGARDWAGKVIEKIVDQNRNG